MTGKQNGLGPAGDILGNSLPTNNLQRFSDDANEAAPEIGETDRRAPARPSFDRGSEPP